MCKNIIISAMAAALIVDKFPWGALTANEQAGLWIGMTTILIIFCFFGDVTLEKWRKRRNRVQQLQQILEQMRGKEDIHRDGKLRSAPKGNVRRRPEKRVG